MDHRLPRQCATPPATLADVAKGDRVLITDYREWQFETVARTTKTLIITDSGKRFDRIHPCAFGEAGEIKYGGHRLYFGENSKTQLRIEAGLMIREAGEYAATQVGVLKGRAALDRAETAIRELKEWTDDPTTT